MSLLPRREPLAETTASRIWPGAAADRELAGAEVKCRDPEGTAGLIAGWDPFPADVLANPRVISALGLRGSFAPRSATFRLRLRRIGHFKSALHRRSRRCAVTPMGTHSMSLGDCSPVVKTGRILTAVVTSVPKPDSGPCTSGRASLVDTTAVVRRAFARRAERGKGGKDLPSATDR